MQYRGVEDVRQGKYFVLTLSDGLALPEAQLEVERIAREVLVNPVIKSTRIDWNRERKLFRGRLCIDPASQAPSCGRWLNHVN